VRLLLRAGGETQRRSELALTPQSLDRVLELPLRAEAAVIRSGIDLPFGLSLLAVFEPCDPTAAAPAGRSAQREVVA
jgi:hypothetical protein